MSSGPATRERSDFTLESFSCGAGGLRCATVFLPIQYRWKLSFSTFSLQPNTIHFSFEWSCDWSCFLFYHQTSIRQVENSFSSGLSRFSRGPIHTQLWWNISEKKGLFEQNLVNSNFPFFKKKWEVEEKKKQWALRGIHVAEDGGGMK